MMNANYFTETERPYTIYKERFNLDYSDEYADEYEVRAYDEPRLPDGAIYVVWQIPYIDPEEFCTEDPLPEVIYIAYSKAAVDAYINNMRFEGCYGYLFRN